MSDNGINDVLNFKQLFLTYMRKCTNKITMAPIMHHENPENDVKLIGRNILKSHTQEAGKLYFS